MNRLRARPSRRRAPPRDRPRGAPCASSQTLSAYRDIDEVGNDRLPSDQPASRVRARRRAAPGARRASTQWKAGRARRMVCRRCGSRSDRSRPRSRGRSRRRRTRSCRARPDAPRVAHRVSVQQPQRSAGAGRERATPGDARFVPEGRRGERAGQHAALPDDGDRLEVHARRPAQAHRRCDPGRRGATARTEQLGDDGDARRRAGRRRFTRPARAARRDGARSRR